MYRFARTVNTVSAVASGKPTRVAKRATNIAIGRTLGRVGFWQRLWR
jgi:hypothetical protein